MKTTTELIKETGLSRNFILSILKKKGIKSTGTGEKNVKLWNDEALNVLKEAVVDTSNLWTAWKISGKLDLPLETVKKELKSFVPVLETLQGTYYSDLTFSIIRRRHDKKQPLGKEKAEDHPLVTDHRWLELNQWPDTVPRGWEEY